MLESARQKAQNGMVILNPRNVDERSLFAEDRVFTSEVGLHSAWVNWARKQREKPKPGA